MMSKDFEEIEILKKQIKLINCNINKKEDDLKNIINEMNDKIYEQNNEIKNLNEKINVLMKNDEEKDKNIKKLENDFSGLKELVYILDDIQKDKYKDSNRLKNVFTDNFNMALLPEKKPHFISYDKLNADSPLLSMPTISKKDGILECNCKKLSFQKGPFCPDIYSKPIILNIVSLVDEEIKAEIEEFPDDDNIIMKEKNEEENDDEKYKVKNDSQNEEMQKEIDIKNIPQIKRPDFDSYKYMRVKNYIQSKEFVQIEIYIPNSVQKGKIENQIIKRKLKLSAGKSECEVEIEMKILTVPVELLLSCENYKLEYINRNYYLKTYQILSEEKLVFTIQNYIKGDNNEMKARIDSLEGNTSKEPTITTEENILIINIPKI